MFIISSLADSLFVFCLSVYRNLGFSYKAVPAYVPQSRIPRKKSRDLNSYVPTYQI